nr:immunoglobulin heavy chain junction region [Mus musculus]
CARWDFW